MQKVRVVVLLLLMTLSNGFITQAEEEKKVNKVIHTPPPNQLTQQAYRLYNLIDFGETDPLNPEIFVRAYFGYLNLKANSPVPVRKDILSVCDFSLSSNVPRLWVIDLNRQKVLFHTLVAHGQGTGEEFATYFSNRENSHQSSFGFYVTGDTYTGGNGYSLRLNGMDRGYNHNAMDRAIVMHGADYVSNSFIKANKRLGRSWGCPAVPRELAKPIIDAIKDGSCLFIFYPDKKYLASSQWLQHIPASALKDSIHPLNTATIQASRHQPAAAAMPQIKDFFH